MTLSYIFSNQYLFDSTPPSQTQLFLPLLIIFGVLLLMAIMLKLMKFDKALRNKQFACYLTISILGFIYLGARYESLPWLGSRLFLVLIALTTIIWISIITVWGYRHLGKKAQETILEDRYHKYLPKQKVNK